VENVNCDGGESSKEIVEIRYHGENPEIENKEEAI
jgi:hypothetical protein